MTTINIRSRPELLHAIAQMRSLLETDPGATCVECALDSLLWVSGEDGQFAAILKSMTGFCSDMEKLSASFGIPANFGVPPPTKTFTILRSELLTTTYRVEAESEEEAYDLIGTEMELPNRTEHCELVEISSSNTEMEVIKTEGRS